MDDYRIDVYCTALDEIRKVIRNDRKPAYAKLRDIERIIKIVDEYNLSIQLQEEKSCQRGAGPPR